MKRKAECPVCRHRTWREMSGFLVMGCGKHGLRFGIAPDIRHGYVNRAGGCAAMPQTCTDYS